MYMRSFMAPAYGLSDENWVALNRAFRQRAHQGDGLPVRLDVEETASAYSVTADLPGVDAASVELSFEDGMLSIQGSRKLARDTEGTDYRLTERRSGSFSRRIGLKNPVDASAIGAKFDKGVLTVTLPKQAQADKAHKITIQ